MSVAATSAAQLVAELNNTHGISADVHELTEDQALISVYYGLVVHTDGTRFWWTSPARSQTGRPLRTCAVQPDAAAARLAEHYRILCALPLPALLGGDLPLLADALAEHVVPV